MPDASRECQDIAEVFKISPTLVALALSDVDDTCLAAEFYQQLREGL